MRTLEQLQGGEVIAGVAGFKSGRFRLHGVESSGVWLHSQELTDSVLALDNATMDAQTWIVFVPWHQVTFIAQPIDAIAISSGFTDPAIATPIQGAK